MTKEFWKKVFFSGPLIYIFVLIIIAIFKDTCSSDFIRKAFYTIYWSAVNMFYMVYVFVIKQVLKVIKEGKLSNLEKNENIKTFKKNYSILWLANFLAIILYFILFSICTSRIIFK